MKKILLAFFLGTILLASCKKDVEPTAEVIAQDIVTQYDLGFQADFEADVAASFNAVDYPLYGSCPAMTFEQTQGAWPNTFTLDYSTIGCTKSGNRVLKGKIIVSQTKKMTLIGAKRTVTFDHFSINNVGLSGTVELTYNGAEQHSGQLTFTRTANQTLSYPDGTSTSIQSNMDLNADNFLTFFTDPYNSLGWMENTDSGSGTSRQGVAFTFTSSGIAKTGNCDWVGSGYVQIKFDNTTWPLNLGSTCNTSASLQTSSGTKDLKVHHWWQ
jgi:hypothetical protein